MTGRGVFITLRGDRRLGQVDPGPPSGRGAAGGRAARRADARARRHRPGPRKSGACCSRAIRTAGRRRPRSCCSPPRGATIWKRPSAPALDRGAIVVSRPFRGFDPRLSGRGAGDLRGTVDGLHALMIGIEPDLTLLIDIDPRRRRRCRGAVRAARPARQRFEDMGPGFQARLRAGFLALAAEHPARCRRDRRRAAIAEAVARLRVAVAAVAAVTDRGASPNPTGSRARPIRARPRRCSGRTRRRRRSSTLRAGPAASRLADHRAAGRRQGDARLEDRALPAGEAPVEAASSARRRPTTLDIPPDHPVVRRTTALSEAAAVPGAPAAGTRRTSGSGPRSPVDEVAGAEAVLPAVRGRRRAARGDHRRRRRDERAAANALLKIAGGAARAGDAAAGQPPARAACCRRSARAAADLRCAPLGPDDLAPRAGRRRASRCRATARRWPSSRGGSVGRGAAARDAGRDRGSTREIVGAARRAAADGPRAARWRWPRPARAGGRGPRFDLMLRLIEAGARAAARAGGAGHRPRPRRRRARPQLLARLAPRSPRGARSGPSCAQTLASRGAARAGGQP